MRYDAIVVGAGPAGSTAAREAATRGLSVLLLDKAEFPRDKPCGGGVCVATADLLPFDLAPVVERTIYAVQISLRRGHRFTRRSPAPLIYLTQRRRLDAFLVEQAVAAGATLREGTAVRAVEPHPDHVVVRAGGEVFTGRTVIAADGANGRTAKLAGLATDRWHAIGLEGNITPLPYPDEWVDRIELDVGDHPGGYGWIFPKGDHLNFGIAGWTHLGPGLRDRLAAYTRASGFDPGALWGIRGHHLPIRKPDAPLVAGNVALVGDAAGFVDPFTGEGMRAAVWSGRAAVDAVADYLAGRAADLRGYARAAESGLLSDMAVSRQLQDLFHLTPALYVAVARWLPGVWPRGFRLLQGDLSYTRIKHRIGPGRHAIDLLSDLIRTTPFLQRRAGIEDPYQPERFRAALTDSTSG
jgi:geranylgeranyl reductase family protein